MARPLLMLALIVSTLACAPAGHAQRTLTVTPSAASEQRVALIIGNAAYAEAPLRNPVNDATDMARALEELGFAVTLRTNASHSEMEQAIRQFGLDIRRGGTGLFFFAGHGIQSRGTNYLVPVGANIKSEADLKFQSVDTGWVLAQMEEARNRVNIVILDACRNNPYERSYRSAARGLAQMDAAKGSFLAFATAPGDVAQDGAGRNGTYTKHLLENLKRRESDIFQVFSRVSQDVAQETREKQIPWFNSSLTGRFQFRPEGQVAQTAPNVPAAAVTESTAYELAFWESIKTSTNRADFEEYLRQYPEGRFAGLARNRLPPLSAAPQAQVASVAPQAQVASAAPLIATRPPAAAVEGRVERPDVQVGDQWTYQVTDRWTNEKKTVVVRVSAVTANRIQTRSAESALASLDLSAAAGVIDVWDRDWNQLKKGEMEYTPFFPWLQFPLENGKRWSGKVTYYAGQAIDLTFEVNFRVLGWERVTVPAGTFDAVKISRRGDFWATGNAWGTGTVDDVAWYAPAIRQFVKKDIEHLALAAGSLLMQGAERNQRYERWELVDYKPN